MRIGYVQLSPVFGARAENLARAKSLITGKDADLWVLPELFATGYQFRTRDEVAALGELIPAGPTTHWLIARARACACYFVAGLVERDKGGKLYNSALLVGPTGVRAHYRKVHLFNEEKRLFARGDTPFPVVDLGAAKVGMMICFDHLFPEAARTLALAGAEVIAHPANLVIPEYGQLTMRVRAIENGVFTVTANRIGVEIRGSAPLHFTGESQIVAPSGEILARGPRDREEARVVEIDPAQARDKRITQYNDRFADRRPEFYRC